MDVVDDPDDQSVTFELDALEFEEILKNFEVDSELNTPGPNQNSTKPLRYNKRDPRLSRYFEGKNSQFKDITS